MSSRVSLSIFAFALCATPALFCSCDDDNNSSPAPEPQPSTDWRQEIMPKDSVSAIDLLRADKSKETVVTGDAFDITTNEAVLPYKLNVDRGNFSSSQYGALLSDDPTADLLVGKQVTNIIGGNDIFDLDYMIMVIHTESLRPNTVYRYRPYYCYSGPYIYGEIRTFTTLVSENISCTPVDLGLSVNWAAQNLGASLDFQNGLYFSYGDTSALAHPVKPEQCYVGNICGTELDPATHLLGEGWSSPTQAQIRELVTKCSWAEDVRNGYKVFKVTGPNGHFIYLPLSGYYFGENDIMNMDRTYLWSGDQQSDKDAHFLNVYKNSGINSTLSHSAKHYRFPIRPVFKKP